MDPTVPRSHGKFHKGIGYYEFLSQIHQVCKPCSYLEIGVGTGATLGLAECRAVAIDPKFQFRGNPFRGRAETHLFQMTSDEFFARHELANFLPDGIGFAFLDGLHHFEYLLRDFVNTERYSRTEAVVALHDCCPINTEMAKREPARRTDIVTRQWWTGDVWKLLPILRDFRPDLEVSVLDCSPTGLVLVRGLDPGSKTLLRSYDEIIAIYADIDLVDFGIKRLRNEFSTIDSRSVFEPDALKKFLARRS